MKKHLKKNNLLLIIVAAAYFISCGKKSADGDFVARVNDVYLSGEEISLVENDAQKEEFIRNWINNELLYNEAVKYGILDSDDFKTALEKSQKELAKAFLLKLVLSKENFKIETKELEEYYNKNKNDFLLANDAYLINKLSFNSEDKAILFRSTAIESDWNKALNIFKNDSTIKEEAASVLKYETELHPAILLRVVKQLIPSEISIVLQKDSSLFSVVQLIQNFRSGEIPPFNEIKTIVELRFLALKREQHLNNLLNELYSKNDIEIKK